jgi:hypothetical protein
MTPPTAIDDGRRVYTADITRDNSCTDRCLRKWIATDRFPSPDGNLNGRNFWLWRTYEHWKQDVLAGKYRRDRRPPGQRRHVIEIQASPSARSA